MGQYSVNNRSVETLLSDIRGGTMVVPEIQRPFVWTPTKVRDLMDSLYKGYPIGYIVVWRSPSAKLKDGTPSLAGQIIIDGQQRITALESAIIGRTVINKDYERKRIKISFNPQTEEYGGDTIWKAIDYFCHLAKYPSDFTKIQSSYGAFANEGEASAIEWAKNGVGNVYIPDYKDCLRVAFTATFCRGKFTDLVELLSGRDFKTREYKDAISQDAFGKLRGGVLAFVNKTNFQNYVMILTSAGLVDASLTKAQGALNFGYALYLLLHNKKVNPAIVEKAARRLLMAGKIKAFYCRLKN